MLNVELVQDNFIYYHVLRFQVDYLIIFLVIVSTDTHTQTHTDEGSLISAQALFILRALLVQCRFTLIQGWHI